MSSELSIKGNLVFSVHLIYELVNIPCMKITVWYTFLCFTDNQWRMSTNEGRWSYFVLIVNFVVMYVAKKLWKIVQHYSFFYDSFRKVWYSFPLLFSYLKCSLIISISFIRNQFIESLFNLSLLLFNGVLHKKLNKRLNSTPQWPSAFDSHLPCGRLHVPKFLVRTSLSPINYNVTFVDWRANVRWPVCLYRASLAHSCFYKTCFVCWSST